jgi:hypothetical protein
MPKSGRDGLYSLDFYEFLTVDRFLLIADQVDDLHDFVTNRASVALEVSLADGYLRGGGVWSSSDLTLPSLNSPGSQLPKAHSSEPPSGKPSFAVDTGDVTVLEPQLSGAKGGVPGPPNRDGGGDGGGDGDGDDGEVVKHYFSGNGDDIGYDIWIEFKGTSWTFDLQQPFKDAADYFTTVITDDIGGGGRYRGKIIDDIYITAELMEIDGPGNVLGRAGPTAVWTATDLPAAGIMEFDIADVQTFYDLGLWDDIVTHEMMHVLGFGSLWNYGRHTALTDGYEYIGANALEAYREHLGDPDVQFIPIEDGGGSGTAGAHWDEEILGNELMTGYIDPNNYLSKFSVMALADLGYAVTYVDYPYDDVLIV